jgi:transposase-like protein
VGDGKRQGRPEGWRASEASWDEKLGPLAPGQRWTVARKREAVLRLLRGESVEMLSRELGVEIYRLERWRDKAGGGQMSRRVARRPP